MERRYSGELMIVYFLRHAEAEPDHGADFDRRLTTKGLEQAAKTGKFLLRSGITPDLIITSPVVRAKQTAEIVANALGADLVEDAGLACGMVPESCCRLIESHSSHDAILLVGHEPDFSEAIARLLGLADAEAINIRKSSITAVDISGGGVASGQLQFLVPARLM
jgi:phosphohistidine phosphatase